MDIFSLTQAALSDQMSGWGIMAVAVIGLGLGIYLDDKRK